MNADGSVTVKSDENIATRTSSYPDPFRWMHFGYFETNNLNPGHEVHTYWDDIYIDDSWARVEIGDQPVYSNCTHLEAQKIVSWNSDRIDFITNNGSFSQGDTAYLYVIDAAGNNNDQGVEITIGGTTIIRADVDQNSTVNSTDAMLTLRNSLGLDMSGTNWVTSATTGDVDCNGVSNSTDAMLLLRYSLGLSMDSTDWCE